MAKGSKKQDKAERALEEARAKLADLQDRYVQVQQKGRQRIERATQKAEEKLARVAKQVDRQTARVARAEERVYGDSKRELPEAAAAVVEYEVPNVAEIEDEGNYAAVVEDEATEVAEGEHDVANAAVVEDEVAADVIEDEVDEEVAAQTEIPEAVHDVMEHEVADEEPVLSLSRTEMPDAAEADEAAEVAEAPEIPDLAGVAAADETAPPAPELEVMEPAGEQPETAEAAAAMLEQQVPEEAPETPETPAAEAAGIEPIDVEGAEAQPETPETAPVMEHEGAHEESVALVFQAEMPEGAAEAEASEEGAEAVTPEEVTDEAPPPPERKLGLVVPPVDRPTPRVARAEERTLSFWVPETSEPAAPVHELQVGDEVSEQSEMPEADVRASDHEVAEEAPDEPHASDEGLHTAEAIEQEVPEGIGEQPESPIEIPLADSAEPPAD